MKRLVRIKVTVWVAACLIASVVTNQTRTEGGAIYFAALAVGYIAVAFIVLPEVLGRLAGRARKPKAG